MHGQLREDALDARVGPSPTSARRRGSWSSPGQRSGPFGRERPTESSSGRSAARERRASANARCRGKRSDPRRRAEADVGTPCSSLARVKGTAQVNRARGRHDAASTERGRARRRSPRDSAPDVWKDETSGRAERTSASAPHGRGITGRPRGTTCAGTARAPPRCAGRAAASSPDGGKPAGPRDHASFDSPGSRREKRHSAEPHQSASGRTRRVVMPSILGGNTR